MERPFPNYDQQAHQGCVYLSKNEIHEFLVEGLNRTIQVGALDFNRNGGGSVQEVQRYLARRYGGQTDQYRQRRCSHNTYMIRLPLNLDRDQVITYANLWGILAGWEMSPWNMEQCAFLQPGGFKVYIKITNFPYEFWHPSFVQMVVAPFGDAEQIDNENLWGEDATEINVTVNCLDPKRIPPSSILPFGDEYWKECFIEIVGWEYNYSPPEEGRYDPGEEENARDSLIAAHERMNRLREQRRRNQTQSPNSLQSSSTVHGGPTQTLNYLGAQEPNSAKQTPSDNGHMHSNVHTALLRNQLKSNPFAPAESWQTERKTLPPSSKTWEVLSEKTDSISV